MALSLLFLARIFSVKFNLEPGRNKFLNKTLFLIIFFFPFIPFICEKSQNESQKSGEFFILHFKIFD